MIIAELYYGNGEVTIEGSEIRGLHIKYDGDIKIEKTAGDDIMMTHNNKGIIFVSTGGGYLSELFKYSGTLKITYLLVADKNAEEMSSTIKKVMDYSELIESNSEDMTIVSENMSSSLTSLKKIKETPQIWESHTKDKSTPFYLKDGSKYEGYYYIDLKDSSCLTGMAGDQNSQLLYYKQIKFGKLIDKLVPTGKFLKKPSYRPAKVK